MRTYRKNQSKETSLVNVRLASTDNILDISDEPSIQHNISPTRPKSASSVPRKRVMMHTRNDFMLHLSRTIFGCIDSTDYDTYQDEDGHKSKETQIPEECSEAIYEAPIQEIDIKSHRSDISSISGFLW